MPFGDLKRGITDVECFAPSTRWVAKGWKLLVVVGSSEAVAVKGDEGLEAAPRV